MNPAELIAEVRSFMKARALLTAAELDLFTQIHKAPCSAQELAQSITLDLRALTRLLDTLVAFGLIKKTDDRYSPTEAGLLLSSAHPESVLPFVLHLNNLWDSWSHLTETIKNGPAQNPAFHLEKPESAQRAFIGAMHVLGRMLSQEIAAAYDLSPFTKLLDIGGGSGIYTIAFLKKNPRLRAVIFDLKKVIPLTSEKIQAEGLSDRVELVAGDFYHDELPPGCDLALLSAIIHQNSPEQNLALYRKIFQSLNRGGTLLIRDFIMDEDRTNPSDGALFALNMLVNTPGGDTYTFMEIKHSLKKTGFTDIQWIPTAQMVHSLVAAKKPF